MNEASAISDLKGIIAPISVPMCPGRRIQWRKASGGSLLASGPVEAGGLLVPSAPSLIDARGKVPVLAQAFWGHQPELTDQLRSTSLSHLIRSPRQKEVG